MLVYKKFGERGEKVWVQAGNIILIPAGTGNKCISNSNDFTVAGAYPDGLYPDLIRGENNERPNADKNIAAVPIPATDPLPGKDSGLIVIWKVIL